MCHNSGDIVFPWSMPSSTWYVSVGPWAVMIKFSLLVVMSWMILQIGVGIRILCSALRSMSWLMESNALLMSWLKIQSSLLFFLVSSTILFRIWIGVFIKFSESLYNLVLEVYCNKNKFEKFYLLESLWRISGKILREQLVTYYLDQSSNCCF